MSSFTKDPAAVLDYRRDWSQWLADGETITESTWAATDGITIDSDTTDGTTTTVWLSGGTAGEHYDVTNTITTDQGRTDERTLRINVHDR